MSWDWYSSLTDAFKKRAGRYLINRYLGTFLENGGVLLNQLSVDGDISLRDVALNIGEINHLLEGSELPVEFIDGYIGELSVTVPWANLLTENCYFAIDGLTVTLQVRKREHPTQISASIFHSMCESFSSMSMAEECLKETEEEEQKAKRATKATEESQEAVKGIELVAQAIDSIIMRVKVTLKNTTFRIEYLPTVQSRGLALELKIGKIIYAGELGQNNPNNLNSPSSQHKRPQDLLTNSTVKKIFFEDVSFYTDDFTFKKLGYDPFASMLRSQFQSASKTESSSDPDQPPEEDLPLQFAALTGKQELVIRFKETNQFGLPRSIEQIELNLGGLVFHMFPHQLHCLVEILSAISVPNNTSTSNSNENHHRLAVTKERKMAKKLENLLQQSMIMNPVGINQPNWSANSDPMSNSTEFQSMVQEANKEHLHRPNIGTTTNGAVPVPRIVIKVVSLSGAFVEKDEGLAKLGGKETKSEALSKMRTLAFNFFGSNLSVPTSDPNRLLSMAALVKKYCTASHLALTGIPLNIVYEEGPSIRSFNPDYIMMTSVTVGQLLLKENLFSDPLSDLPTDEINLLQFIETKEVRKSRADFNLIYKEMLEKKEESDHCKLEISLNPCTLDFEPGLVDRTFLIFNYAELDQECLVTPSIQSSSASKQVHLDIKFSCHDLSLTFQVPKADLRAPKDIPQFVPTFWRRKVHPEILLLNLKEFDLLVSLQVGNQREPLHVRATCGNIEVSFKENASAEAMSLIQVRKSSENKNNKMKSAASVSVAVILDPNDRLRGKYSSTDKWNRQKGHQSEMHSGTYFVSDSGNVTGMNDSQSNIFMQQLPYIEEALNMGRVRHNLLIDLKFDDVSLLLPSKHVYEVIYNRLGNDMLLWMPEIFRVKEFLFNQPIPNPLQDPDMGFSTNFSGFKSKLDYEVRVENEQKKKPEKTYVSFPRDDSVVLNIHTDTCVVLAVKKIHASIATSCPIDKENQLLLAIADELNLVSVVGLEKDPEITLFSLTLAKALVKFGTFTCTLPSLHFSDHPPGSHLDNLLQPSQFKQRAWLDPLDAPNFLKLTAKVLFDSKSNLKTINLAFGLSQASVNLSSLPSPPAWVNWLADFFTVVEYPVNGYIPPAILTEMQFDIQQCSVDIRAQTHPAVISLCLGHGKVACNLIDTGHEVSIGINLENLCLFLSGDDVDPIKNSICICDIDYLDLDIHLKEPDTKNDLPFLDVCASCNLLRIRTCADTILMLSEIVTSMIRQHDQNKADSNRESREGSAEPVLLSADVETVVPDLADAMEELIAFDKEEEEKRKKKKHSQAAQPGIQVFCFPNEDHSKLDLLSETVGEDIKFPISLGMTESYYSTGALNDSNDSYDDFCILDEEIGTGITSIQGEPTSRALKEDILISKSNQYARPAKNIDYLKAPQDFPSFQSRILLKKFSVLWQIFGGHDFSASKDLPVNTRSQFGLPVPVESPMNTFKKDISDLSRTSSPARHLNDNLKTRGGPGRNLNQLIEVSLTKIQFTHEVYLPTCLESSRQVLVIQGFEIRDKHHLSNINKLLHLYSSKTRPRQSNANMLQIRCLQMKPNPLEEMTETSINVSLQPLRVNIDQDTLFFLIDFAGTLGPQDGLTARPAAVTTHGQVVTYSRGMEVIEVQEDDEEEVGEEVFEDARCSSSPKSSHEEKTATAAIPASYGKVHEKPKSDIFIKSFVFYPEVPIRIDYSAKYVDLSQGALAGLLTGLTSLNCSELTLKHVFYENGILGFEKLLTLLVTDWLADIRQNQIPRLLGGVGPMYSVLQLFQGIKDLLLLPLEQYQKDGRFFRGMQKGANSFTTSTAMSFLDFTNKMLGVVKFAAELAFDIMSPEGTVVQGKLPHPSFQRRQISTNSNKPADFREGVFNALAVVREGIDETARTLSEAATSEHNRRGFGGSVGGVLRQMPSTLMRPVIMATAATSNVLEGVQSQVAPDIRKEEEEKWRPVVQK